MRGLDQQPGARAATNPTRDTAPSNRFAAASTTLLLVSKTTWWRDRAGALPLLDPGAGAWAGTSAARVVVHEPQLPAARCALRACEGDGAFEDLGLKECVHELVVCAVAERLRLVADGGGVLGGLRRALFW